MFINKSNQIKQQGFSLVELLAVVGIGGALIAGALLLVQDVNTKKEIKQHSENISAIFTNMQNLFSDEDVSDDMTNLITAGVFPNTLKVNNAGDKVKTQGGGNVVILKQGSDGFTLSYPKIKAGACVEVLKNQKRVGWDTWDVKANTGPNGAANAVGGARFDGSSVASLATACKAASGKDWVDLSFAIE